MANSHLLPTIVFAQFAGTRLEHDDPDGRALEVERVGEDCGEEVKPTFSWQQSKKQAQIKTVGAVWS